MSTTEEHLATGTLTAAKRRERRRARILASSDARLNRILSGPDGEEKRQAPAMEGGEGYRFVSTTYSPPNLSNDVEMEDVMAPLTETMRKFTVAGIGHQPATTSAETEIPSLASLGINYKRPPLFAVTESRRLEAIVTSGSVLFFLEASDMTSTVWITWTIASFELGVLWGAYRLTTIREYRTDIREWEHEKVVAMAAEAAKQKKWLAKNEMRCLMKIPSLASLGIKYKRPPLFAVTESRRLEAIVTSGSVLFFLEASDMTSTVWITWTIASFELGVLWGAYRLTTIREYRTDIREWEHEKVVAMAAEAAKQKKWLAKNEMRCLMKIPSLASLGIKYKRPPLFAVTESRRLEAIVTSGSVLFFLEASDMTSTVWITWTIASFELGVLWGAYRLTTIREYRTDIREWEHEKVVAMAAEAAKQKKWLAKNEMRCLMKVVGIPFEDGVAQFGVEIQVHNSILYK